MTPEEQQLVLAAFRDLAWDRAPALLDRDDPGVPLPVCLDRLKAAALAYARPIVREECARIVERLWIPGSRDICVLYGNALFEEIARTLREHGKEGK